MLKKLSLILLIVFSINSIKINFTNSPLDTNKESLFTLKFIPSNDEFVYYDNLNLTSNAPSLEILNWQVTTIPIEQFDNNFRKTKKIVKEPFTIKGKLKINNGDPSAKITLTYLTNKMDEPTYEFFKLSEPAKRGQEKKEPQSIKKTESSPKEVTAQTCPAPHQKKQALSDQIQNWIARTNSLWLQLLLVFLLGILMSLTPCIYPMIPITVGLLQAQARKSIWYNLSLATAYTLGIALMFAILGLTAAFTGSLFGKLMSKPIVIVIVVGILLYLALAMFGIYELKTPRFLNRQQRAIKPSGSLISAFIFGFISGTVASPCLTPGLAFFIMFAFGIGMSIPLLLIGTFSTSLKFMPNTGIWMLEVKKIFAILLIALCFYYLSNILSITFLFWLIASTLLLLSIYYFLTFCQQVDRVSRYIRLVVATVGMLSSGALYYVAFQRLVHPPKPQELIHWQKNYTEALKNASKQNQLILLDVGAPYCSICKAIDRCIFNEPFIATIINEFIPVQIDAVNSPEYEMLAKKFEIVGVPTILTIHPQEESVLNRWGAELYTMNKQEIEALLNETLQKYKK